MLGVNFGRVGFLAGAEPDALAEALTAVVDRRYDVEERMTLDVRAELYGRTLATEWALNEASVEKSARERMLELAVAVDGHELLRFGCDGVLCATPTGSTAYAYSAGGPILWPSLDALVVVPNAAHALFSRPARGDARVADRRHAAPPRLPRRAELRRPPRDRLAARQPGRWSTGEPYRSGSCGWRTGASPTVWSPSSNCRCPASVTAASNLDPMTSRAVG